MVRRHVWVSGRVQGVWFRQSCAEVAREEGITGWIRNSRDGRVEATFEGEDEAVARIVAWCHDGPPRAVVTRVEARDEDASGGERFSGFSILA